MQLAQVQELINAAEEMVRWNVLFQVEGVEQRRLAGFLTSHHRDDFRSIDGTSVNQHRMINSTEFFNKIDPYRTFDDRRFARVRAPGFWTAGVKGTGLMTCCSGRKRHRTLQQTNSDDRTSGENTAFH
jgi:hypothetical protein